MTWRPQNFLISAATFTCQHTFLIFLTFSFLGTPEGEFSSRIIHSYTLPISRTLSTIPPLFLFHVLHRIFAPFLLRPVFFFRISALRGAVPSIVILSVIQNLDTGYVLPHKRVIAKTQDTTLDSALITFHHHLKISHIKALHNLANLSSHKYRFRFITGQNHLGGRAKIPEGQLA